VRTSDTPSRAPRAALSTYLSIGLVVVAAVLSSYPFIAPGDPYAVDTWPHLARQSIVYHAVKEGFSPFYTFMLYCGFPVLRFYSPLLYFLGGPLTLLTAGNLVLALRILLVALHLVSALTMYLYLRRNEENRKKKDEGAGLGPALGAIVYLVIPWRVLHLSVIANYPQALVYVLLPLVFAAVENVLAGRGEKGETRAVMRQGLLLGLWVSLLFLSHLVYAVFTLLFLAVWWVARAKRMTEQWRPLGVAILAGVGVSAFFLVPFVVEQAAHRFPITHLNLGVPDLMMLLGVKVRTGGYGGAYFGVSVILVLLAAVGAVLFNRRFRCQVPALLGLTGSLFLTFGPSLLREKQYLITAGLPPERFLVFVVFFTALLVPSAYELVRSALARRRVRADVVFGVIAGLVMLDCLLNLTGFAYADRGNFLAVRGDVYRIVANEPHARLLDLDITEPKIDDVARTLWLPTVGVIFGRLPTPLGLPYHQYAPRTMLHVYPWVDYITRDIADTTAKTISDNTRKALAFMGANYFMTLPTTISTTGNDTGPFALLLKDGMDWNGEFVAAQRDPPLALGRTHQGLVLAANKVVPMAPETLVADHSFIVAKNWRRLLDVLQLDETNHSLNFIPVPAGTEQESLPGLPAVEVSGTRIRHQDVVAGLRVNVDCFLRVAISYYPELEVLLDGKPVHFAETADHFVYIRCPAGLHALSVRPRLGGLRVVTLLVSLFSLPVVLVLIVVRRRKPKPLDVMPDRKQQDSLGRAVADRPGTDDGATKETRNRR